jgi:flagellar biosynthesis/type III secretory pathway protein FliH
MSDPDIERAKPALDDLSADPKARELARDREIWRYFYDRGLQLAERGGREKGIAEGRAKGIAEGLVRAVRTACELLGVEFTAARQAYLAQASTAELEKLLDSLERDRRWPD